LFGILEVKRSDSKVDTNEMDTIKIHSGNVLLAAE
jgi:hypothetical protein